MANEDHLRILKQGVDVWNKWRAEDWGLIPDLTGTNLNDVFPPRPDSDISNGLFLRQIEAEWDFRQVKFVSIRFNGYFPKSILRAADFSFANLSKIRMEYNDCQNTKFIGTNLAGADLHNSDFRMSDFTGANLTRSHITASNFTVANLNGVDFNEASVLEVNFSGTSLENADFSDVRFAHNVLVDNDISSTLGLDKMGHQDASYIGINTIYRSKGHIPEIFLRGCGLPEALIIQIPALIAAIEPIQFYSCFISYSSKDQDFAERLHRDMQNKGVRCWFAPEDLKIGDRFRQKIDESIRFHDKLLLILSENSISSPWVEDEVESALERERIENRTVLFPVRIDDAVMFTNQAWAASLRRNRHIGNFTDWGDYAEYQKAFDRLLRDLKSDDLKERRA